MASPADSDLRPGTKCTASRSSRLLVRSPRAAPGRPDRKRPVGCREREPLSTQFVSRLAERFPQLQLEVDHRNGLVLDLGVAEVAAQLKAEGLKLSDAIIRRYHTSLRTRGFVVLTGISGTGKTWLAEAYARTTSARVLVVPVAPNWTTNEDLL